MKLKNVRNPSAKERGLIKFKTGTNPYRKKQITDTDTHGTQGNTPRKEVRAGTSRDEGETKRGRPRTRENHRN